MKRASTMKPIIRALARESRIPQTKAARLVEHFLEILRDDVWAKKRVNIPKLGVFRVTKQKARRVTWRHEGEEGWVDVPERDVVSFRASKQWRTRG